MASVDNTQIHLETLRMNSIQTENSIQQIYSCQSIRNFPSFSFEKINPSSLNIFQPTKEVIHIYMYISFYWRIWKYLSNTVKRVKIILKYWLRKILYNVNMLNLQAISPLLDQTSKWRFLAHPITKLYPYCVNFYHFLRLSFSGSMQHLIQKSILQGNTQESTFSKKPKVFPMDQVSI